MSEPYIEYIVEFPDGRQDKRRAYPDSEIQIEPEASSASWISMDPEGRVNGGGNDYSYDQSLEPGKTYKVECSDEGVCYPVEKDGNEED